MASQVYVPAVIVLPLKVLATREVIRERMDYKDYLGGNVREELDRLNGFEGNFLIDTTLGRDTIFGVFVEDDENHHIKAVTFRDTEG